MKIKSKKIWIGASVLGTIGAILATTLPIALISKNYDADLQTPENFQGQTANDEALFTEVDNSQLPFGDAGVISKEVKKVHDFKYPDLPMSKKLSISYDDLPFKKGRKYSGEEFVSIIKDLGLDLEKDYGWPKKQMYVTRRDPEKIDYVRMDFKFLGIDEETGIMNFDLHGWMRTWSKIDDGYYWVYNGYGYGSYKVPLFQSLEYTKYYADIEKDLAKFEDINVGLAIENNYDIANLKVGDKLGESNFETGCTGKITDWEFAYEDKRGSLEEIFGEINNPKLTRKYYVDQIYESGVIDLRVEVWNDDRHKSSILKIGNFINSRENKDQVEYDAQKFLPFQSKNPLVLNEEMPLPEVGEIIGSSSKLDRNYDGVYKYHDDYRLEGKINNWSFKKDGEINSIDQIVGPATWLTSREYKVINVDYGTGTIGVEVTISSGNFSTKMLFYITNFMTSADYGNRVKYDGAKFDEFFDKPATLVTPQPLPKVGDILGTASKLDENNDGQYKYQDDYKFSGIINKWQFRKNRYQDCTLDHLIGPATWLVSREYKVVEVDPRAGTAEIEVEIISGDKYAHSSGYYHFKISNFIPE